MSVWIVSVLENLEQMRVSFSQEMLIYNITAMRSK